MPGSIADQVGDKHATTTNNRVCSVLTLYHDTRKNIRRWKDDSGHTILSAFLQLLFHRIVPHWNKVIISQNIRKSIYVQGIKAATRHNAAQENKYMRGMDTTRSGR